MKIKCKVLELIYTSWGVVAVLDFHGPTPFKVGDILTNSDNLSWQTTRIFKGHPANNEDIIPTLYVWDFTIKPINHDKFPFIGEELTLIREGE